MFLAVSSDVSYINVKRFSVFLSRACRYSNCAFGLLADVLSGLEHTDFAGLMGHHIFKRLNMTRSALTARLPDDPFIANGHAENGNAVPIGNSMS